MISIIIATKNRYKKLQKCIQSIINTGGAEYQIIIIDQGNTDYSHIFLNKYNNSKIIYYFSPGRNKSKALNQGLQYAMGEILAFTDDDCIVSEHWVKIIESTFRKYPTIDFVTGDTYPYKNIPLWACPPTMSSKFKMFTKPVYHPEIGFGNNMAIRKTTLESIGPFKTWLSPGSIGTNSEDGEMMIRVLIYGYRILHTPDMIVYHNKKLTSKTLYSQNLSYSCGEMASYGYFHFLGYRFAAPIITGNIVNSFNKIKNIIKTAIHFRLNTVQALQTIIEIIYRIRGLTIGFIYALIDPLR